MSENLQYWINYDGDQSGPHTIEQLQAMAPFDVASTYIWHKGMDGWMRIDKLPELAHLTATTTPQDTENTVETEGTDHEPQHPSAPQAEEPHTAEPSIGTPPPYSTPQPPQLTPIPPQPSASLQSAPECPPTNLVAAIVCAVLCCTPLAIVAIVLAVLTKSKYQAGDYAKAEKYSEWGAWLCIASVVLSVLFFPFSMLVL